MPTRVVVYLALMAAAGLLALLMAQKDAPLYVLIFTVGLGLPLIFIATVLPYMAFFLPAVVAPRRSNLRRGALLVGFALSAAWALVPNWLSNRQAEQVAALLQASDIVPAVPVVERTLELRGTRSLYEWMGEVVLPQEPCPSFCRSLLLGGEVDWVRVVMPRNVDQAKTGSPAETVFYVVDQGAACTVPGEPTKPDERCIRFAPDTGQPAGLVAQLSATRKIERLKLAPSAWIVPVGERVVTFKRRVGDAYSEVLRHTEPRLEITLRGSVLGPWMSGDSGGGTRFVKWPKNFDPTDFEALLRSAGYRLRSFATEQPRPQETKRKGRKNESWRDPPDVDQTRAMMSLLELPGQAPFNEQQGKVIDNWIMKARAWKEWPPERIELLRRILRDRRVRKASFFGQVFSGNPAVAAALMPDALDRIEVLHERSQDPGFEAGYAMAWIDPAILKPYRTRVLELARRKGAVGGMMLNLVGRVGINPAPLLRPLRVEANDWSGVGSKIHAACLSEDRWGDALRPMLRELLTEEELGRSQAEGRLTNVLRALARFGDIAFVEQAAARSKWVDAERQVKRIKGQLKRRGQTSGIC